MLIVPNFLQKILLVIWVLLILPLPFDHTFSIDIDRYTLRASYLIFALLSTTLLLFSESRKFLKIGLLQKGQIGWLILCVSGFFGLQYSPVQTRSVFFLAWAALTLVTVPPVIQTAVKIIGRPAILFIIAYGFLHALVVIIDAAICIPSEGKLHIGNIQVYDYIIKTGMHLCRPSAGYQEPSYFAIFTLLIAFLLREYKKGVVKYISVYSWIYKILLLAIFMSTSRLGWLGILYLLSLDLYDFLRFSSFSNKQFTVKKISLALKRSVFSILFIFLSVFFFLKTPVIYNYLIYDMIGPKLDGGMNARARNLRASLEVFREHPWFGVGPGAASAYHIDIIAPRVYAHLTQDFREHWRNAPLSQNLYTEILSEWGVFGFVGFFIGFYFLLLQIPQKIPRIQFTILLGIIATASQTIAKLDFWILVSLIIVAIPMLRDQQYRVTSK